jgi:hypothetical protein
LAQTAEISWLPPGEFKALAGSPCDPPDASVTPRNMTNRTALPPYLVPQTRVASRRFGLWISPQAKNFHGNKK